MIEKKEELKNGDKKIFRICSHFSRIFSISTSDDVQNETDGGKVFRGSEVREIKEKSFYGTSHALKVSEKVFPTPSMHVFARSKFFSVCLQTDNNPTRRKSLFTILS